MAFLDGNQPDRLCAPMKAHVEARGGEVRTGVPVASWETNEDGTVSGLKMRDGTTIVADEYVSALPVDVFKRMLPEAWQTMPYFRQTDQLEARFLLFEFAKLSVCLCFLYLWTLDQPSLSHTPYLTPFSLSHP